MLFKQTFRTYLITGILFTFITSFSQNLFAQEKTFVQLLIQDINSHEQAQQVDSMLTSKPGVQFTRFNFTSQNLLLVFNSSEIYAEEDFASYLSELGFHFVCYHHGILGLDTMKELTISECSEYKPKED